MKNNIQDMDEIAGGGGRRPPVKSIVSEKASASVARLGVRLLVVLAVLALIGLVPVVLADPAPNPIATSPNGTFQITNAKLFVQAQQPQPFANQTIGGAHDFNLTFTLPATVNKIIWARLYEVWYSGSGINTYAVNATTWFNGNSTTVMLGDEHMNVSSGTDGHCFWINDHVSKVYSDFMITYNVTGMINRRTIYVNLHDYGEFDGRCKSIVLVVAYNKTGSLTPVYYNWVNVGQEWFNGTGGSYPYLDNDNATFDTSVLAGKYANASDVWEVSSSSKDAIYAFNGYELDNSSTLGQYGYNYFNNHTWSSTQYPVYNSTTPIASTSTFSFRNSTETGAYGAGSYQIQLAALSIYNPQT